MNEEFFSYAGSYTTPPCQTGLIYNIQKKVLNISDEQLTKIRSISPRNDLNTIGIGNNRAIQPRGTRTVFYKPRTLIDSNTDSLKPRMEADLGTNEARWTGP